jgi:glucose/arabinose dehydrogenase
MRPDRRSSVLAAAVAASMLVASGCGSDGATTSDTSFGVAPPTTASTGISGTATPSTAPPIETTPGSGTTPGTVATSTSGPRAVPAVSLFDIGSFDQPVQVTHRPGDSVVYVVEQPGRVVAVTDLSSETVLDITDLTSAKGERGLLGLAFHPTADLAYVDYTDNAGNTMVAEFAIDPDTGVFDRTSQREVLTVRQPYTNHNGGQVAFGPDQLLYIGLGDGGSGGDPQRHALDLGSRLGKILRIDPAADGDQPFTVPADNPFVTTPGADPTIWAYGLRNPWRFSFDAPTGDLWIADVGQDTYEEIDHSLATDRMNAAKGANFGWSALEGFEPYNSDQTATDSVAPVFVYDHSDGRCSVSGGAVARGDAVVDLQGWYVFGDFCTGQIWALDPSAPPSAPRVVEIAKLGGLTAISVGPDNDLFAVSSGGTVARLVPA